MKSGEPAPQTMLCAVQDANTLSVTTLASDAENLSRYLKSKGIQVSELSAQKTATFGSCRVPQLVRQFTAETSIDHLAEHTANWSSGLL